MSDSYADLVKDLNARCMCAPHCAEPSECDMCEKESHCIHCDAADAIETLVKERDEARADYEAMKAHNKELFDKLSAAEAEVARLREALTKIANHWANSYDHKYANLPMYEGAYGIGVTDGHRNCTTIARAALGAKP